MRHHVTTVFDEYIPSGGVVVYTSQEFNKLLGHNDQIGIMVVVDNVSGTSPVFDLWIEHSADARLWIERKDAMQTQPPPETATTGDISITLSATAVNVKMISDACLGATAQTGPLLPFVRFGMKVSGTSAAAHVRVHCVGRGD